MADEATTATTEGEGGTTAVAAGKTFTQDDLDRIVGERLAKDRQKYADYDDLKAKASRLDEQTEAQKTEAQKALDKANKEAQRAEQAERELLRYQVAADKKIPADAMDLLHGSTREALEAQADRILALTNQQATSFDGGARGGGEQRSSMDSMLRQAAGYRP